MKQKAIIKSISEQITGGGQQTVRWDETLMADGYKLRICIKSDKYRDQSHATVEVFNKKDLAWNGLHTITGDNMNTRVAYQKDLPVSAFAADRDELIRVALAILGQE